MVARKDEPSLRSKRLVIKVGSSVLTETDEVGLNMQILASIASQISNLLDSGREIVLVSSGAIAAGLKHLNIKKYPKNMPERQAAAAVGQPILMDAYSKVFNKLGLNIAQILLTHSDLDERERFLNACNTIDNLLHKGVVPIVNENDTVSTEEIKFGDNDSLAVQVAQMTRSGLVVILSDVEGMYNANPNINENAKLLSRVDNLSDELINAAGKSNNKFSHGGMVAKIKAIQVLSQVGISTLMLKGRNENVVLRSLEGEDLGSFFVPKKKRINARKSWIGTTAKSRGWLKIDHGAVEALLRKGRSLLPSGVVDAGGNFSFGDVVELQTFEGKSLGRGLVNYNCEEVKLIAGKQTREISSILGSKDYDEIVHRNNFLSIN
ncbi:MAG: glutamate 5-kinase [Nitrospinota bacterium]|nr:glutamate 5-kinase [Nitrospinota bacterium]